MKAKDESLKAQGEISLYLEKGDLVFCLSLSPQFTSH